MWTGSSRLVKFYRSLVHLCLANCNGAIVIKKQLVMILKTLSMAIACHAQNLLYGGDLRPSQFFKRLIRSFSQL